MDAMKYPKTWLIETLKANRAAHRLAFLKAQDGYKTAVIEALEKSLADARAGRAPNLSFRFPVPTDQTRDYDRVLSMLANSLGDEVVLEEHEYAMYVLDQWQWKQAFATTVQSYGVAVEAPTESAWTLTTTEG